MKYGCHNREPLVEQVMVQKGWTPPRYTFEKRYTRGPVLVRIPNPNTKDCQFSRQTKNDPACEGCIRKNPNGPDPDQVPSVAYHPV